MYMCTEKQRLKDREKGSKGKQEERGGEERGCRKERGGSLWLKVLHSLTANIV